MSIVRYLPSTQFALIVFSILLSGGLVLAAEHFTNPEARAGSGPSQLVVGTQNNADWLQTLREIQAENSAYSLPAPPDESAVQTLLNAAKTKNLTETVGRTLLVNLSDAKAQGLGDDIPTQNKLIANAAAQIEIERGATIYTSGDLSAVENTGENVHAYGNDVMALLAAHPKASYYDTLLAIGYAADYQDPKKLESLSVTGEAYADLALALSKVAVPQTLAPLHLQVVNDFARIASLYPDMQAMIEDPLRGLGALQLYESLIQETARVFTNIAQQLSKNGILFNTSEPGSAWNSLFP